MIDLINFRSEKARSGNAYRTKYISTVSCAAHFWILLKRNLWLIKSVQYKKGILTKMSFSNVASSYYDYSLTIALSYSALAGVFGARSLIKTRFCENPKNAFLI